MDTKILTADQKRANFEALQNVQSQMRREEREMESQIAKTEARWVENRKKAACENLGLEKIPAKFDAEITKVLKASYRDEYEDYKPAKVGMTNLRVKIALKKFGCL